MAKETKAFSQFVAQELGVFLPPQTYHLTHDGRFEAHFHFLFVKWLDPYNVTCTTTLNLSNLPPGAKQYFNNHASRLMPSWRYSGTNMKFVSSDSYPTLAKKPKASQDFLARIGNPSIPHDHDVAQCLMGACCILIDSGQIMTPNGKMEADQYIAALRSLNPNLPQKLEQEARDGGAVAQFHQYVKDLEAEAFTLAQMARVDPPVRAAYASEIAKMAEEQRALAKAEALRATTLQQQAEVWRKYADAANKMRNNKLTDARAQGTAIGEAVAKAIKPDGITFAEMEARKAQSLYKRPFQELSKTQQVNVWEAIIESSGKSNPIINLVKDVDGASAHFAKVFYGLTAAIGLYEVINAENKALGLSPANSSPSWLHRCKCSLRRC